MSQMMVLCGDHCKVECQNCDWTGTGADLDLISDFENRVVAGEIVPAGQCPVCCALAHLTEDNDQ